MPSCIFYSTYGYNSLIRDGKIYTFPSLLWVQYLLECHQDLIFITPVFNRFVRLIKERLKYIQLLKRIRLFQIRDIELGKFKLKSLINNKF